MLHRNRDVVSYALVGRLGEIWELTTGKNGLSRPGCIPKYLAMPATGVFLNGEKAIRFGAEDLDAWIGRLDIPADPTEQALIANTTRVE